MDFDRWWAFWFVSLSWAGLLTMLSISISYKCVLVFTSYFPKNFGINAVLSLWFGFGCGCCYCCCRPNVKAPRACQRDLHNVEVDELRRHMQQLQLRLEQHISWSVILKLNEEFFSNFVISFYLCSCKGSKGMIPQDLDRVITFWGRVLT